MISNLVQMLERSVELYNSKAMYGYKVNGEYETINFSDFYNKTLCYVSGFKEMGIKKEDRIFIFSDNRLEWIMIDFALQYLGAISVPRGTDTVFQEAEYIMKHSESNYIIIENVRAFEKLGNLTADIKKIAVDDNVTGVDFHLSDIYKIGCDTLNKNKETILKEAKSINSDDVVTMIYTSGTTGNPKGVMLTHRSILKDVMGSAKVLLITKDDTFISMLPIWHVFQRTCEYITIYSGSTTYYSNLKNFTKDVKIIRPTMLALVPRILEAVYDKVWFNVSRSNIFKKGIFNFFFFVSLNFLHLKGYIFGKVPQYRRKNIFKVIWSAFLLTLLFPFKVFAGTVFGSIKNVIGGRNRIVVSGGGSLSKHIDEFFNAVGLVLLNGYGLTETSPIIAVRSPLNVVLETVGIPIDGVEVKIIDETGNELKAGERGELIVRGDIVMKEYYKNSEATAKVLKDGWIYTGDLATKTAGGEIQILGRIKDTIVLSGGENVEPEKIESYLISSPYISNAVVVGQNKKRLGALITLDKEKVGEFIKGKDLEKLDFQTLIERDEIIELVKQEIKQTVNSNPDLKHFERIYDFKILSNQFEIGDEITQTLKIRRHVVLSKYKKEIDSVFNRD